MGARTGADYVASLRRMKPAIYLGGRRVECVADEPVFQGPIQAIAELYDLQHDPRYRDFMLYPSPSTGDPVHVSFQVPRSKQELVNKRKAFKLRTEPWLFVVDKDGKITARLEGSFGLNAFENALKTAL